MPNLGRFHHLVSKLKTAANRLALTRRVSTLRVLDLSEILRKDSLIENNEEMGDVMQKANSLWEVAGNGGYPIIDFTAEYRLKPTPGEDPDDWKPVVPTHIPPNSRQIDVYHLEPNTTYSFRVWAIPISLEKEKLWKLKDTNHSMEELATLQLQHCK